MCDSLSDGSVWWYDETGEGMAVNERASDWMNDRGMAGSIHGPVLYMSAAEVKAARWVPGTAATVLSPDGNPTMGATQAFQQPSKPVATPPTKATATTTTVATGPGTGLTPVIKNGKPMLPLIGNTFAVKDELKKIGGWWDKDLKRWFVPAGRITEARAILAKGPTSSP